MSIQIDFRTLPANVPVLCIPRVYPNISESRIRKIFEDLDMGTIERVDMVSKFSAKDKADKFNRVFVHFRRWNDSENARIARERLLNGKEIKIIYDDPWFWKISAYREPERKTARTYDEDNNENYARKKQRDLRPRLLIDDDNKSTRDRATNSRRNIAPTLAPEDTIRIAPTLRKDDTRRIPSQDDKATIQEEERLDTIIDQANKEEPFIIDYGDVPLPPPRKMKRNLLGKKEK